MIRLSHVQTQRLFALHKYIHDHFTKADWIKLAYLTNSLDIIEDHPRLLRSLDFDDDDYEGNCLHVLSKLTEGNDHRLAIIENSLPKRKRNRLMQSL